MCESINDFEKYLTQMSKTFFDKAWFMSHLTDEVKVIIDFGCADGSFLKFLQTNCPAYKYIGIDNEPKFIKATKDKGFECYSSLEEFTKNNTFNPNNICLVLSSVIHEIYSYGFCTSFWKQFKCLHPKYIAIRDMMFNPIGRERFYLPPNDYNTIKNIFKEKYNKEFNEFHAIWNKQNNETEIAHFLLKYFYKENWKREVRENYLPITINDLHERIFEHNYKIDFQTFYKLPYLVNKWKNDFDLNKHFELYDFIRNINTHYKMLLVKD